MKNRDKEYVHQCPDCSSYKGLSKDTAGRILCSHKECALYYSHIDEWEEEKNHELVAPGYFGVRCCWFKGR